MTPVSQSRSDKHRTHDNSTQASLDADGDTDPATDVEEIQTSVGAKRKAGSLSNSASRYVSIYSHWVSVLAAYSQLEADTCDRSV